MTARSSKTARTTKSGASKQRRTKRATPRLDFEGVRKLALSLPGVEEGPSYGTPAFRVRKKLIARMWEDLETVVVPVEWDQRDTLLETDPDAFFLTAHYRVHPWICVRVAAVQPAALLEILEGAWRAAASKRQRDAYDEEADSESEAGGAG